MALTYEQRVAKMLTVEDVSDQLRKAKQQEIMANRAVRLARNFMMKIELNRKAAEASSVTRKIRSNLFDLEDQISERISLQQQAETQAKQKIEVGKELVAKQYCDSINSEGVYAF